MCFLGGTIRTRRSGLTAPSSFDPDSREIDAIVSTGMRVRRRDWDGEFDEVLDMSPKAVRLARLNQGAAVLDSHNWTSGIGAQLGGIVPGSARLEDGALIARIKFSRRSELARRIAQDLQDGIQIPLSAVIRFTRPSRTGELTQSPALRRIGSRSKSPWCRLQPRRPARAFEPPREKRRRPGRGRRSSSEG